MFNWFKGDSIIDKDTSELDNYSTQYLIDLLKSGKQDDKQISLHMGNRIATILFERMESSIAKLEKKD